MLRIIFYEFINSNQKALFPASKKKKDFWKKSSFQKGINVVVVNFFKANLRQKGNSWFQVILLTIHIINCVPCDCSWSIWTRNYKPVYNLLEIRDVQSYIRPSGFCWSNVQFVEQCLFHNYRQVQTNDCQLYSILYNLQ